MLFSRNVERQRYMSYVYWAGVFFLAFLQLL